MTEKTLGQRIAEIREKLEPYRFRYFRILRTVILYWFLTIGVEASLQSNDMMEEQPFFAHGMNALSMLVLFIMLSGVFVLYDPTARRHFVRNLRRKRGFFRNGSSFCVRMSLGLKR